MNTRNIRTLQRNKTKKRIASVVILFFLFLCIVSGIYFFAMNYMPVKEIVFINNHHLKNEELKSLVNVRKNDGLFSVSNSEIYHGLKKSPWIKDAVIRKELSGRILIDVIEAVPFAILSLSGIPYLVSKDGVVLEQMKEGTVLFLPVIKDITPDKNKDAYTEALKFVSVLNDRMDLSSRGNIEITGPRPEDIALKIDNISVKIGSGNFDEKMGKLKFVMAEIEKRNMPVESIDLRFANRVIIKPVRQESHVEQTEMKNARGKKKKK